MISYEAKIGDDSKPYLAQVLTAGSQSVEVKMNPTFAIDELNNIPLLTIHQHIQNILAFIKAKVAVMEVRDFDAPRLTEYPLLGWEQIHELVKESKGWDEYVYANRDSSEEEAS